MEDELPTFVDSTMLTCARGCLQKFYNEFVLGLRPARVSIDLHAGGVFASTIEAVHRLVWEQELPFPEALIRAHGVFLREWGDFPTEEKDLKNPSRMWDCVEEYFRVFPPAMDHCKPFMMEGTVTSEFSFAIPLEPAIERANWTSGTTAWPRHPVTGEPFLYSGRADMLGSYKNRIAIRDEKTASKLDSNWSEKWDLRAQFMGYCWAAQQGGLDCDTVIVRGVIPYKAQRPKIVEAIKFFPRWQIDRWVSTTRATLWRIVDAWHNDDWEFNLGDTCTQYGNCPFMPLCTIPDEQRENWRSTYTVRRWNPLNRNPLDLSPSSSAAKTAPNGSPSTSTPAPVPTTGSSTPVTDAASTVG